MDSGQEQRRARRRTVHIPAWISSGDGAPVPCQTWDIAHTGARLTVAEEAAASIPDSFELHFSPSGHPRRFCSVIWRDGMQIGVKFVPAPDRPKTGASDATPLDC